jgi:ElaB/YqjD/DUF883 family membrane-anchored ribosome-binding protein
MIDRIRDEVAASSSAADRVKDQALEIMASARERLGGVGTAIRDFTQNQPGKALGIALGMGVFLGWLIKRR